MSPHPRASAGRERPRRASKLRAVLLAALAGACQEEPAPRPPSPPPPAKGPDLVLITIDTLRADRLELYGYHRATAPALDALGRRGVVFEQALSQAPWTLPAMATVHTGLYPSQHGVFQADRQVAPHATTLAEVLRENGYRTAATVSHTFTSRRYGFDQGFERFDEQWISGEEEVSSEEVTRTALEQYRWTGVGPRFLWVHYFDPHYSYVRHPEYGWADESSTRFESRVQYAELGRLDPADIDEADRRYVEDVYDEEIRHTDQWIGALIEGIEELAADREVVFLVTADHGEYFLERGRYGHGKDVYRELVQVPLILAGEHPSIPDGLRIDTPVETAAIPATFMQLAGIEEHPFRGRSLLDPGTTAVFSDGNYAWGDEERKRAVILDPWKMIRHFDDERQELYHIREDPDERVDRIDEPGLAEIRARLVALLDAFEQQGGDLPLETLRVSDEEKAHLEALGYSADESDER